MTPRDEVARQALSYIMQRDPDIVADAFQAIEPRLKRPAMRFLADLVRERLDVLRKVAT